MAKLKEPKKERLAQGRAMGMTLKAAGQYAGYKHKQSAHRVMMTDADVAARVDEISDLAAAKCQHTVDDAIAELEKLAFANIGKFYVLGTDGLPEISFAKVTADDACALADLTVDEVTVGARTSRRVKIKLHDKASALVKFIEMKGKQEERERQALEDAKTINGEIVDVKDDYLADLGRRYHLRSLELRANGVIGKTNGKTNGNGSGS